MKSFNIGVFNKKNIHQAAPLCGDNVFAKGLEKNGWNVTRYDYREPQTLSIIERAKEVQPDMFWFGKCESVKPSTLKKLRHEFPDAEFVKWATDVRRRPVRSEIEQNRFMDWYFATFGGDWLKKHLNDDMKGGSSMITFTDSDVFFPGVVEDSFKSEVLFTGRTNMSAEVHRGGYLSEIRANDLPLTWYGQNNWIGNPGYRKAINGAKIGLGLTHFIRPLYTSARLGHYTACGTFFLIQYFPGIEQVYSSEEMDWFQTPRECMDKIKYYLKHEDERKEKAEKAMKKTRRCFDYEPLVNNLLHIIETGESQYSWDDVFLM